MATINDMKGALLKAHNAGDTEAAQLFASKIKEAQVIPPKEYSGFETLKNIPESAVNYATGITAPIHSPIKFAKGLYNLAAGGVEKLIPGEQPHEKYIDAAGQFYKDRYGKDEYPEEGIDNFADYMSWRNRRKLQTFQTDPVGALSDLSLVGSLATMPMKATTAGGSVANKTARAIDPTNMAINLGKIGLKKAVPKLTPAKMYERTAKFSTTIPKKKRDAMVQTALNEKIMPTGKGVAKLERTMDDIDSSIKSLIAQATDGGGKVPASAVFADLGGLRNKLGSAMQTDGLGNIGKINKVAKAIGETQKKTGKEFYTIAELQQLKRNLYKSANFDVKQFKADDAINQARKTIAKKSKSMIEEKVPSVEAMNKRYGSLIDLQDPITRSANRIDNLNAISINQPLNISAGGYAAGPTGAISAGLLTALSSPKVRPKMAMYLQELQNSGLLDIWLKNKQLPYYGRQGLLQVDRVNDQK